MSEFALSYTGAEVNELLATVNDNHGAWDSISQVSDYVVAQGTSGDWNYIKFASGLAIVSGTTTVSSKISTAWGGIYETPSSYYVDYPIKFSEIPVCTMGISSSTGAISGIEVSTGASTTRTPIFWLMRGDTGGDVTYTTDVSITAIGRWK